MNSKTITVRSIFPSSAERIWEKLQDFKTLTYLTKPLLSFKPRSGDESGFKWLEGERYFFNLRLLSLIPIDIIVYSQEKMEKHENIIGTLPYRINQEGELIYEKLRNKKE